MTEEITMFDFLPKEQAEQFKPKKSTDWKWTMKDDYPKEKNGLTVFSCFACGDGSTMGYKLAGCDVIGDLEIDPKMNEVYIANHHPKHNLLMDIRDLITFRMINFRRNFLTLISWTAPRHARRFP